MAAHNPLWLDLLAIFIAAWLVLIFPRLQTRIGRFVIGAMASIVIYRETLGTVLVAALATWFAVVIVHRIATTSPNVRKTRWNLSVAVIAVITIAFIGADWYGFKGLYTDAFTLRWTLLLPDMWLLLRLISYVWEFGAGRVNPPDAWAYARWLALPFTLHGPFFRYSMFVKQEAQLDSAKKRVPWKTLALGAVALVIGLGLTYVEPRLRDMDRAWTKAAIALVTGPWGFYLTTTGTFHLMEGFAAAWGFALPRSFHRPFGRRNLSDFWQNWNIPVTDFLRDALFYQRWGMKKVNPYVNVILLFLAVGLWHGRNWYWTFWGLLHGVGFCVFMLWKSRKKVSAEPNRIAVLASVVLTYLFVCACWYLPNKIVPHLPHR